MQLHPIPPDPEPTEAELQPYLNARADDQIRRPLARLAWRVNRAREDPDAFLVPFFPGSKAEYDAYIYNNPVWAQIRVEVLEEANWQCAACPEPPVQVHHRDYRPRVLSGEDRTPLVPLCVACHFKVHNKSKSVRRKVWQDCEAVLARLVAKRGETGVTRLPAARS